MRAPASTDSLVAMAVREAMRVDLCEQAYAAGVEAARIAHVGLPVQALHAKWAGDQVHPDVRAWFYRGVLGERPLAA